MKKITRQLQNATQHIGLHVAERSLMRERLVTYMEYKPLRSANSKERSPRLQPKQHPVFSYFRAHHFRGAMAIALIVATSTAGISSAATNALPGDLLYPVKVNMNEGVVSMMHTSQESKLLWERERAERRLLEASELMVQGRLGEDAQDQVKVLFNKHAEAVVEQVKQVEQEDPVRAAELSDEFEQALDTHGAVLTRLMVEESDVVSERTLGLVEQVKSVALEAGKIRENVEQMLGEDEESPVVGEEDQAGTSGEVAEQRSTQEGESLPVSATEHDSEEQTVRQRAAARAAERALKNHALAEEVVQGSLMSGERMAEVEGEIEVGDRLIEDARELEQAGKYKQAYRAYREASAIFQQVAQLARASERFDIAIVVPSVVEERAVAVSDGARSAQEMTTADIVENEQASGVELQSATLEERASTSLASVEQHFNDLVAGGLEPQYVDSARVMLKDAHASYLRAQIAQGLGDTGSAEQLFEFAIAQADRIADHLGIVTTLGTTGEMQGEGASTTEGLIAPEGATSSGATHVNVVSLDHRFLDDVHVFEGVLQLPTPCHMATVTATTSGEESAAISFDADVQEQERGGEDEVCAQQLSEARFEVRVEASPRATTTEFRVNGEPVSFTVTEGAEASLFPEEALEQEPASSTEGNSVPPASLFERALRSTQSMFRSQ